MNTQLVDIVYNNSYNVTNCYSRIRFQNWFQNVLSNRFTLIFLMNTQLAPVVYDTIGPNPGIFRGFGLRTSIQIILL